MKTIGILLILLIFVMCAVVGFQAASRYYAAQPTPTPRGAESTQQGQQNIFLLHVDSLEAPTPVLESVWGLFTYFSNTPSLIFVPLYQPETGAGVGLPLTQFSLTSGGDVPGEFLQTLREYFNFSASDYVVLDDEALAVFHQHFQGQGGSGAEVIPGEPETLANICAVLQDPRARKSVDLPWSEVVPDHLHTNMPFDNFMGSWLRVVRAAHSPTCKILTGN